MTTKNCVYSVVTVRIENRRITEELRVVGLFTSFAEAEAVILSNELDIHERSYNHALVEKVLVDCLYPQSADSDRSIVWYAWVGDADSGHYEKCHPPEGFGNVIGWGIG